MKSNLRKVLSTEAEVHVLNMLEISADGSLRAAGQERDHSINLVLMASKARTRGNLVWPAYLRDLDHGTAQKKEAEVPKQGPFWL